jgi:hypothetical protein
MTNTLNLFRTLQVLLIVSLSVNGVYAQKSPPSGNKLLLDSIRLSDPFIFADEKSRCYYMTGTGGKLWKSKDLKLWQGPYDVVKIDTSSWMGSNPMIWAAEIHRYKNKYYYFATFTNQNLMVDVGNGKKIERRACHILVSDKPDGPYSPMKEPVYLPADMSTLDATLWIDTDGKPYMVYCFEWIQNNDGTIEKIELKPDLSGTIGKSTLLFRASESPWSRERDKTGKEIPNKVTDGPFLFRTSTGRLGMLWTSWVYHDYTQGVAYSASGTLNGPWVHEKMPLTPPNYGHGMLFRSLEGKLLMAIHSHKDVKGDFVRVPQLFEVSVEGETLRILNKYRP